MRKVETHETRGLWRVNREANIPNGDENNKIYVDRACKLKVQQNSQFQLTLRNISRRGGGQGAQINAASTSDSLPGRWSPKVCCFACWARIQIWKATIQTDKVWIRCRKMGGKHGKHLDKGKKTTFGILRQCLFFLFIVFWYFATCPDDLQHDLVQMLQLLFWFLCSRWAPFLSCFLHAPACAGHLYNHFFDNHLMVEKKNKTFAGMNWIWNVCRILQVSLWMNNILKYVQQFQQVFKTSKNILFF